MPEPPPLRGLHGDAIYDAGSAKNSLEFWQGKTTDEIIASLQPGLRDSLKTTIAGLLKDGNTRIKVLVERGIDANELPREIR